MNIGDYKKAEVYGQKSSEIAACWGIGMLPNFFMVQVKFRDAYQYVDSTCQIRQCEQLCFNLLFRTSFLLGEYDKAAQYFNQFHSSDQVANYLDIHMNYEIGYVYYQLGKTKEAEEIFSEHIKKFESELDSAFLSPEIYLARIYAFKGEKDKALDYLERFTENRGFRGLERGWHDFILIDPFFESLRDDPEFKAIVKQVQDEKATLREQVRRMEERGELML